MTEKYSTINDELDRINGEISDTYDSLEDLGATIPQTRNLAGINSSVQSIESQVLNRLETLENKFANYIPANSSFVINPNGTKDFTTFSDALAHLRDHWSDGRVYLFFSDGIHTINELINIGHSNYWYYRYPTIMITSQARNADSCILHFNVPTNNCIIIAEQLPLTRFANLTFESNEHDYNTTKYWGIQCKHGASLQICNCKFNWLDNAITADYGSQVHVYGNISISNSYAALVAQRSGRLTSESLNLTLTNIRQGINVNNGGIVQLNVLSKSFTNVTTVSSQEIGTCSVNGIITGKGV